MFRYNNFANPAVVNELMSDLWIEQNIPGGLNSPLGEMIDNAIGGNPNPTVGQIIGGAPGVGGVPNVGGYRYNNGFGTNYGYQYGRW